MATTLTSFRAPIVSSATTSDARKPDPTRRSNNWWAPIFGWSADPDYIGSRGSDKTERAQEAAETGRIRPDKCSFVGCLTEEKARELRRKMIESTAFHDVMYHSAIAARLASDVSGREGR